MEASSVLLITTAIMTVGGLTILAIGKRRTPSEELHTVLHGIVPIIAACSYFAMATGQGAITLPTDAAGGMRVFYYARYIDWFFTTPLLLVTLTMTAMRTGTTRFGAMAGVVLADIMMILTALFFGLSTVFWIKWAWFAISCIAFLGVYYVIWGPNLRTNAVARDDARATYTRNAVILSVLWLVYPVVLAVAPDGLNIVSDAYTVLAIAVLDVLAKVVYGLMSVASDTKATDLDLRTPDAPPSLRAAP